MTKLNVGQILRFVWVGLEILLEKETMVVTSIFSISQNVFKNKFLHGQLDSGFYGKELIKKVHDLAISALCL